MTTYIEKRCTYMYDWAEKGYKDLIGRAALMSDFEVTEGQMQGVKLLFASYTYQDYEGEAFVLFEKQRQLYEVNGSHCSCYGLEGQWEPEETSLAALRHRLEKGELGSGKWGGQAFAVQLSEILKRYERNVKRRKNS